MIFKSGVQIMTIIPMLSKTVITEISSTLGYQNKLRLLKLILVV